MHDSMAVKAKSDRTFDPLSEHGSSAWCGAVLGKTSDWLRKNRVALEADGFSKVCRLVGLTLKADVRARISKRPRYADIATKDQAPPMAQNKERFDRF